MSEGHLMEQIRQRAYQLWLDEGCPDGRDRIHWLKAEAEFREKLQTRSGAKENRARRRMVRADSPRSQPSLRHDNDIGGQAPMH
jgi:hypothetical protein